ncbi:hypothetical protein [Bacillus pseudomycoides]|uniref:hypothetical protein n=1 Tax=Bacillus pseudomycoides TaxID=64104 RepID=UPI0023DA85B0|nr:hypothetical protein [Bacillus pseudomycoides]MDF2082849.1 hypothetical protein [Bacillus pseudomycoides]
MFDCCGSHHHGSHFKKAVSCPTPGTISVPFPTPCPSCPPITPCPPCITNFRARTASFTGTDTKSNFGTGDIANLTLNAASDGNDIGFGGNKLVILTPGNYNLYYAVVADVQQGNLNSVSFQLTNNDIAIPGTQVTVSPINFGGAKLLLVPFAKRPGSPVPLVAGSAIGIQMFGADLPGGSTADITILSATLTIESA